MELLLHDVIEDILETVDVKTLLKFMSVSKQWKSTIQSRYFQRRQMIHHRKQSIDLNVLLVSVSGWHVFNGDIEALRTLVVGPWSESVQIPTPWENKLYDVCNTSCDGLICLYDLYELPSIVVNPTTRWHQTFPLCNNQLVALEKSKKDEAFGVPYPSPGFGKDNTNGTYKPVWLYNSAQLGLNDDATTCEAFDFDINTWRYVVPASTHLISHIRDPVYLDGSLHWFTALSDEGETMVLSLDLHNETFQVIAKAPFLHVYDDNWIQSTRHGRIYIYIYSIDLVITSTFFPSHMLPHAPLAVLDKDKLLCL